MLAKNLNNEYKSKDMVIVFGLPSFATTVLRITANQSVYL